MNEQHICMKVIDKYSIILDSRMKRYENKSRAKRDSKEIYWFNFADVEESFKRNRPYEEINCE